MLYEGRQCFHRHLPFCSGRGVGIGSDGLGVGSGGPLSWGLGQVVHGGGGRFQVVHNLGGRGWVGRGDPWSRGSVLAVVVVSCNVNGRLVLLKYSSTELVEKRQK